MTYMTEPSLVDLVGVGLNATDTLIPLPSFPQRGSKVEYSHASILPGGQTATAVIACQTWGLTTRYVGKLGDDDAASLHRREFVRAGVDARLITVPDAASPQSLILVDGGGERTVFCRRDERLLLQPADLDRSWIVNARALHVDGFETAAATVAAAWAHAAGIPVRRRPRTSSIRVSKTSSTTSTTSSSAATFPHASPANAILSKPSVP